MDLRRAEPGVRRPGSRRGSPSRWRGTDLRGAAPGVRLPSSWRPSPS